MRKKLLSFLALLMTCLALPQAAWADVIFYDDDYDGCWNTDIKAHIYGSGDRHGWDTNESKMFPLGNHGFATYYDSKYTTVIFHNGNGSQVGGFTLQDGHSYYRNGDHNFNCKIKLRGTDGSNWGEYATLTASDTENGIYETGYINFNNVNLTEAGFNFYMFNETNDRGWLKISGQLKEGTTDATLSNSNSMTVKLNGSYNIRMDFTECDGTNAKIKVSVIKKPVATVTLSGLQISTNNGSSWSTVTSGSETSYTLNSSSKVLVKCSYSNSTSKTYTLSSGVTTSISSTTMTEGSTGFTINGGAAQSANITVTCTDTSAPKIAVSVPFTAIANVYLTKQSDNSNVGGAFSLTDGKYVGHPTVDADTSTSSVGTWYRIKSVDTNGNVKYWALNNTTWWFVSGQMNADKNLVEATSSNNYKFCLKTYDTTTTPYLLVTLSADGKSCSKLQVTKTNPSAPTVTFTSWGSNKYYEATHSVSYTAANLPASAYYYTNYDSTHHALTNGTNTITIGQANATADQTITITYSADGTQASEQTVTYKLYVPHYYLGGKFTGSDDKWSASTAAFEFTCVNYDLFRLTGFTGFNGLASKSSSFTSSPRFCVIDWNNKQYYTGNGSGTGNWIVATDDTTWTQANLNGTSGAMGFNFEGVDADQEWTIEYVPSTKTITFATTFAPSVTYSQDGGDIYSLDGGTKATVKLTPKNTTSWWYKVGSGARVDVNNGNPVNVLIGTDSQPAAAGVQYTIAWGTSDDTTTAKGSKTFTLKPVKWYLHGEFDSSTWTTTDAFTGPNASGEYTLTFTPTKASGGFGLRMADQGGTQLSTNGWWRCTANTTLDVVNAVGHTSSANFAPSNSDNPQFKFEANTLVTATWNPTTKQLTLSQNIITYEPNQGHEQIGSDNLYSIYLQASNGTRQYYKVGSKVSAPAMHRAPAASQTLTPGTYNLVTSDEEWTFALAKTSYEVTVNWEDNVAKTLTVRDPDAITWVLKGACVTSSDEVFCTMTPVGSNKFEGTFTATARTVNSNKFTVIQAKGGVLQSEVYKGDYWFKPTVTGPTTVSTSSNNNLTFDGYSTGDKIKATFDSDTKQLTIVKLPPLVTNVYLYRNSDNSQVGEFTLMSNGTYEWGGTVNVKSYWENNVEKHHTYYLKAKFDNNSEQWYTVSAGPTDTNYWITPGTHGMAVRGGDYNFVFNCDETHIYMRVYLNDEGTDVQDMKYDTKPLKESHSNLPAEVKYRDLNVMPNVVRRNDADWSKWLDSEPVVYVRGDYLNNNRLVPDWEMDRKEHADYSDYYELLGVSLRGDYAGNADAAITALPIFKNNASATDVAISNLEGLKAAVGTGKNQVGRQFNLYLHRTSASADWVFEWELVSNLPPYIGLVGKLMTQEISGDTPNGRTTDVGWQEAYVLYDEFGYPLYDLEGEYIYSTQWPPRNPIYFKSIYGSNREIDFSSADLTFTSDKSIKSGLSWETLLQTDSDYAGLNLVDGQLYARYVISDVWFQGGAQLWTGWGSQEASWGANWNSHLNWGINQQNSSDKYYKDDGQGCQVTPGVTANMTEDASNVFFGQVNHEESTYTPQAVYYKSLEFYLPVDADGKPIRTDADSAPNSRYSNARLYVIAAYGAASIQASAGTGADQFHGTAIIKFEDLNESTITSATIYRYDASTDFSKPRDQWNEAGILGNGQSVSFELTPAQIATLNADKSLDIVDAELANGRYVYRMEYKTSSGRTDAVRSNPFAIFNSNYHASVTPWQMVELTAAGKAFLTGKDISLTETVVNSDKVSVVHTYTHMALSNTGNYYLISDNDRVKSVATATAVALRANRSYYNYTADYFVVAFIANEFATNMDKAVNEGEILGYTRPVIHVVEGESISAAQLTDANKVERTATSNGYRLYGKHIRRNGNLSSTAFTAHMTYTTTAENGTETTFTPADRTGVVTPVMPAAYDYQYTYKYRQTGGTSGTGNTGTPEPSEAVEFTDVNGDPIDTDFIKFSVPSSVNDGEYCDVYMQKADYAKYQHRYLDCEVTFRRPNVAADIIRYYNIHYDIYVTTNDATYDDDNKHFSVLVDGTYIDTLEDVSSESGANAGVYKIEIKNVHPHADIYPTFVVRDTYYENNDNASVAYHTTSTSPYHEEAIVCRNNDAQVEAPTVKVTGLNMGYVANPKGGYDWMYKGHTSFAGTDAISLEGSGAIQTLFYHLELADESQNSYVNYPYLVCHEPDHYKGTHDNGDRDYDQFGCYNDDNDPLIGVYVAKGMVTSTVDDKPKMPDFVVTPIYLFSRDPQDDPTTVGGFSTLVKDTPNSNQSSAPRKAGEYIVPDAGSAIEQYTRLPHVDASMEGKTVTDLSSKYVAVSGSKSATTSSDGGIVTGIESVSADMYDGEAVYYNLQGVRVTNPEAGQVYIIVRGNNVTKELLK